MSESPQLFSSLVGGVLIRKLDLIPSIVLAAAFGLFIPIAILRIVNKRSRTAFIWCTLGMGIEKLILFSIRSAYAADDKFSRGIMMYMQTTIALGPIMFLGDLAGILRSTLVNSTYTPATHPFPDEVPPSVTQAAERDSAGQDQPRRRYWFRRFHDSTMFIYVLALLVGITGNAVVQVQKDRVTEMSKVFHQMRIIGCILILILIVYESIVAIIARQRLTRVNTRGLNRLLIYYPLLAIPQMYRLAVLHRKTPSLFLLDTDSNNTPLQKTLFYILHFVPEWIVCALHLSVRAREFFECGSNGDRFWWDETVEKRRARLVKAEKLRQEKERKRADSEAYPLV